jgi:hypothetical protein
VKPADAKPTGAKPTDEKTGANPDTNAADARAADAKPGAASVEEPPRPEVKIDMSKLEAELAAMRAAAKSDGDK